MYMAEGEVGNTAANIEFKQFDIVSDHSDHYYANKNKPGEDTDCFTNINSAVHRKIMKEWKILKKGIPETIYVRVYEDRIDLLRAVIIGAYGTPYHDGLFFFDIAFPSNYPSTPPKVHYHSHGLRLNPNLYASGHVCLSLLNTWIGKRNEKWDSSESTILQVLVSIQGIVLNDKPYFNEPGTKPTEHGDNQSLVYNENAFILSCKTMLYVQKKPPKNFGSFVAEHFRGRADAILAALRAYRDGCVMVGHYRHGGSSSSSEVSVTINFKANADKLYLDLEKKFKSARKPKLKAQNIKQMKNEDDKRPKSRILRKVSGVLKRFFKQ